MHLMPKKNSHGITKTEWLVAIGIFLVLFLVLDDTINNGKYASRTKVCQSNLGKVGQAILSFRAARGGRMPPNLAALSNKYILECPLTGTDYVYRSLDKPAADDVICWDSHPHEPQHNVFTFLNQPNRNILTTDGKVRHLYT